MILFKMNAVRFFVQKMLLHFLLIMSLTWSWSIFATTIKTKQKNSLRSKKKQCSAVVIHEDGALPFYKILTTKSYL